MPEDDLDAVDTPGDDLRDVLGMPARRAPAVLAKGQIIDDAYRIEEEIGAGGMGRVYRAHDLRLSRDVALKLHGFALARDDDTLRREATALARLTHPNVVTVYEVGTWNGHPWVAMAYVPGGTVRTWLAAKHRSAKEILALFIAAGRGLAAAHAAGLVHRDFKPDNVLVGDDGRICVADFGLARDAQAVEANVGDIVGSPSSPLSSQTKTGVVRGTPAYMAPEQRDGTRVDASADQYAFAVSLWEALAGVRPFDDDNKLVSPPSGRLPRHVEIALRRAMSIAPADRWSSMTALLDELARDPARTRVMIGIALLVMVALLGGGYLIAVRTQSAPAIACDASRELDDTWSSSTRAALLAAYPGEVGTRIAASIGAWADQWLAQRTATCRARATEPEQLVAMRTACLDRARTHLGATLDVLSSKVDTVNALALGTGLPKLADCTASSSFTIGPPAVAPADIASVQAAEALLARARAWRSAGDYPRALSLAQEAVAYTERLGRPALLARAKQGLASSRYLVGEKDVVAEYEAAVKLAAAAHDDVLVVEIYFSMLEHLIRLQKHGEIDRLLAVTATAIERANRAPALEEKLVMLRADIARSREQFVEAAALLQRGIAAHENRYGEDQELARALTALASTHLQRHLHRDARSLLVRAAAIMERLYGNLHPNLAVILTTLGGVEQDAGNYDAAVEAYRKSLALKEATVGPQHRSLLATLVNLASTLSAQGKSAEAIPIATRAATIAEAALPPGHPQRALTLVALGEAQRLNGDWAAAAATIDKVVASFPPDSMEPLLSDPLRIQGLIRDHENNGPAARAAFDRALAIAKSVGPESIHTMEIVALIAVTKRDLAAFDAAVERIRAALGPTHPRVAELEAMRVKNFGPTKAKPR